MSTVDCGEAPAITAGSVDDINDTAVLYKCISGYTMQGYEVVLCEYGKWSQDFPTCMIKWRTEALSGASNYTASFERPEVPDWLLMLWATFTAVVGLAFTSCLVLLCIRLCWCCKGKAVMFGGTFRYSETWIARHIFFCCKCEYKPILSRKKMMLQMLAKKKEDEEDNISLAIEERNFVKFQKEMEIRRAEEIKAEEALKRQNAMGAENVALVSSEGGGPETAVDVESGTEPAAAMGGLF